MTYTIQLSDNCSVSLLVYGKNKQLQRTKTDCPKCGTTLRSRENSKTGLCFKCARSQNLSNSPTHRKHQERSIPQ